MFRIFRDKRIKRYSDGALLYVEKTFTPEIHIKKPEITYSDGIKYSMRRDADISDTLEDKYDSAEVGSIMKKYNLSSASSVLALLNGTTNKTFVETVIFYANRNGMKYSEIYKAAQIDRRLFSKIISDKNYKPSKDTALAVSLALHLSFDEAIDLLNRAGYTFSHSNKRDIIVEYFFREEIYNLNDINLVLFNLEEKVIGR